LAHVYYGWWLATNARFQEAQREYDRGLELDPRSAEAYSAPLWGALMARQYDQALELGRRATTLEPTFSFAHAVMALAHALKGQSAEAIAAAATAVRVDPSPFNLALQADVYALAGRRREAEAVQAQLQQSIKHHYVCSYEVASAYIALRDYDQAYKWLDKAYDDRSDCMIWLKVDPRMDEIRKQPRFQEIMRKVGFKI